MEDKQKILDLFLPALQATRNISDLVRPRAGVCEVRKRESEDCQCCNGFRNSSDQRCNRADHIKKSAHISRQA